MIGFTTNAVWCGFVFKASLFRDYILSFSFLPNTCPEGFPPGYNSTSAQGNYLEAINLSFNGKFEQWIKTYRR